MKKKEKGNAKCGSTVDPAASNGPECGAVLPQAASPVSGKKKFGFWGVFFSTLFSLLLTASTALLVPLLFLHALNEHQPIPAIGSVSASWLAEFFDSGWVFALGGTLVLIPLLAILLINTHRVRRVFLSVGVSAVAAALLSAALGFAGKYAIKLLSGDWQDALLNTTAVFKDFSIVCALILVILGAACLSIYSLIAVLKGGNHE